MSEQTTGNYDALMWVQDELQKSLILGQEALQQFIEQAEDHHALSNCVEQLYQAQGTLDMLNLQGAHLLASEMLALISALRSSDSIDRQAALDALVSSFMLLPAHLKLISRDFPDHPLSLLDTINLLRSLRQQPVLPVSDFLPAKDSLTLPETLYNPPQRPLPSIDIEVQQLPHAFQHQLLLWLRQADDANLRKLRGILRYLRLSHQTPQAIAFWWLAEAFVEGLIHRGLPASAHNKQLLGKLLAPLKTTQQGDESFFLANFPEDLLHQLFLLIAQATSQGATITAVKAWFKLTFYARQKQLYGISDNALVDAQTALLGELRTLKEVIDVFDIGDSEAETTLADVSQQLLTLSGILDLLDQAAHSATLKQYSETLTTLLSQPFEAVQNTLSALADDLLTLESELSSSSGEHSALSGNALNQLVIQECLAELLNLKEALTLTARQDGQPTLPIEQISQSLQQLTGSLDILGQDHISQLLKATDETLAKFSADTTDSALALEHLAEILSACEFYLESAAHHDQASTILLAAAHQTLAHFGHPRPQPQMEPDATVKSYAPVDLEFDISGINPEAISDLPEPHAPEVDDLDVIVFDKPQQDTDLIMLDEVDSTDDSSLSFTQATVSTEATPSADYQFADGIDPELASVFVEEAAELLSQLETLIQHWHVTDDAAALADIRRGIHTLKGSGRMAGAHYIATLAMELESVLNEVLDGFTLSREALANVLLPAVPVLYALLRRFIQGQPDTTDNALQLQNQLQDIHSDDQAAEHPAPTLDTTLLEPALETEETFHFSIPVLTDEAATAENSADETDELMAIFLTEAQQHLDTLQQTAAESKAGQVIEKTLLSAAHSLKGCANIADVTPIALIATELDKALRELHRQQVALTADQLNLLQYSITGLNELLDAIRLQLEEPDIRVLHDNIQQLHPETVTEQVTQAIDPELLVSFLEETDSLLDHYTRQLTAWQQDACEENQAALQATLHTLSDNAAQTDLSQLSELYQTFIQLIVPGADSQADIGDLLDQGYELLNEHIEALIQNKPAPDITAYQHSVASVHNTHQHLIKVQHDAASDNPPALTSVARYLAEKNQAAESVAALTSVARYLLERQASTAPPALTSVAHYLADKTTEPVAELPVPETSLDRYIQKQARQSAPLVSQTTVDRYIAQQAQRTAELRVDVDTLTATDTLPPAQSEIASTPLTTEANRFFNVNLTEVDPDLLDAFCEESEELLISSQHALKHWQHTQDNDAMLQLQRNLHTLKGGARLAGITPIADLSHHMESLLLEVIEPEQLTEGNAFNLLQRCQDQLSVQHEQLISRQAIDTAPDLIAAIQAITTSETTLLVQAADSAEPETRAANSPTVSLAALKPVPAVETSHATLNPTEQIRVRADLLDYLSNFAGEVSISRDRVTQQHQTLRQHLSEMEETVTRLHDQLRKLEIETETQILYRYEDARTDDNADFDPLELDRFSTIQQLSRGLTESVIDMNEISQSMNDLVREIDVILLQQSRMNTDLQQGLMDTRLLPFSHIVPRLERIVRQAGSETGKQADLTVIGATQELDRAILDRLVAPLEHLLRNAIAHGIEAPEQRQEKHKPHSGQLRLELNREGSEIVLTVEDDGQGLDLAKIRQKALSLGLISADRIPSDDVLMQLILSSGFSTADNLSQLAGRGVGMDVVNNEIRALKGRLFIQSTPDKGAKFTIRLPLTLSLIQALLISSHDKQYAIPLASVTAGERIAAGTIRSLLATHQPQYQFDGEQYDFIPLSHLLGEPLNLPDNARQPLPLLLYRSGGMRIALLVNAIHSNREIVIKPVGPQLAHINAINGATILGDGRVVLILDIATLIEQYKSRIADNQQQLPELALQKHQDRNRPVALIVDDSITMRKASGNLLGRLGFDILTAKDGVEALAQLHEKQPDIILLDVEMPRMDGFEFASIVRNDSRFRHLPIVMITSRTGDKHRQRALDIGVNDYLGKPYQENELIASLKNLLKTFYPSAQHS